MFCPATDVQPGLVLHAHGATACTDVTGFGLVGHLVEMLKSSGCSATVDLAAVPALPGARECMAKGVFSSLFPANARLRHAVHATEAVVLSPAYPLVFDPQTSGGLLAGVPRDRVEACLAGLRELGCEAVVIGSITEKRDDGAYVEIVSSTSTQSLDVASSA